MKLNLHNAGWPQFTRRGTHASNPTDELGAVEERRLIQFCLEAVALSDIEASVLIHTANFSCVEPSKVINNITNSSNNSHLYLLTDIVFSLVRP